MQTFGNHVEYYRAAETGLSGDAVPLTPFQLPAAAVVPGVSLEVDHLDPRRTTPLALSVRGDLDLDALRLSTELVLQRHAALRTGIDLDGIPCQHVHDSCDVDRAFVVLDARGEGPAAAAALARVAAGTVDPSQPPLLRVVVADLGAGDWCVCLSAHHAVCDLSSYWTVLADLWSMYADIIGGRTPQLPDTALSAPGHARALANRLVDPRYVAPHIAYWERVCAEVLEATGSLGTEVPPYRTVPRNDDVVWCHRWDDEASRTVRHRALSSGVSPYAVLLPAVREAFRVDALPTCGFAAELTLSGGGLGRRMDGFVGCTASNALLHYPDELHDGFDGDNGATLHAELARRLLVAQRHAIIPSSHVRERVASDRGLASKGFAVSVDYVYDPSPDPGDAARTLGLPLHVEWLPPTTTSPWETEEIEVGLYLTPTALWASLTFDPTTLAPGILDRVGGRLVQAIEDLVLHERSLVCQ